MKCAFRFLGIPALLACMLPAFAAQEAVVTKKANLRKDPSAKRPPIAILLPDEEVSVLDASQSRYLKVRTSAKKTGYVLKSAVDILPDSNSTSPAPPAPPTPPGPVISPSGVASTISPDWPKQTPVTVAYEGTEGSCPPGGIGGDT